MAVVVPAMPLCAYPFTHALAARPPMSTTDSLHSRHPVSPSPAAAVSTPEHADYRRGGKAPHGEAPHDMSAMPNTKVGAATPSNFLQHLNSLDQVQDHTLLPALSSRTL